MKRIIKDIFDIKEGEKFYFNNNTKFKVIFNNKDCHRFIAMCEECEEKDKVGKIVEQFNFDGLNSKFSTEFISKVIDENGKEVEVKREERESRLGRLIEGLEIISGLEENMNDEEFIDKAFKYAKRNTLELLKQENISIEDKKAIMENYKEFEESYKNIKAGLNNNGKEIDDFINKLEEE